MNTTIKMLVKERTIKRDKLIYLLQGIESYERIRRKLHDQKNAVDANMFSIRERLEGITFYIAKSKAEISKLKSELPKTDFFKVDSKSEYKSGLTSRDFAGI